MYNKYSSMKKSELKEAIKNEITSVLLEGMSDEEREQRIQHLKRTGAKEKPLRKLAAIGKKEDEEDQSQSSSLIGRMGDRSLEEVYQTRSKMEQIVDLFQDMMGDEYDGMDYRKVLNRLVKFIDDDYKAAEKFGEKVSNIREDEMTDAEKKKAAEKDAKKEKDFANKQKEVDKLKKELADNKDELVKISKISRDERTKAQQNLLDDMAKKTKELKKLRRVEA